jgi:single-stranded-DNA-specific exonuclease
MAAGMTIEPQKIESFAGEFEAYAGENLNDEDVVERLQIDAVYALNQFTKEAVAQLHLLGPFGRGNPRPLFATRGVRLASSPRRVGAKSEHLVFAVTDNTNTIRCVGFGMSKLEKKLLEHDYFDIAYEAQINTYNGSSNVEFIIEDVRFDT